MGTADRERDRERWTPPDWLEAVVLSIRRRWGLGVPEQVLEDLRQEAWVKVWSIQGRLRQLPESERRPYAESCVRRHLQHLLWSEARHQHAHLELLHDDVNVYAPTARSVWGLARLISDHELQLFGANDPALQRLLSNLSDRERSAILLHFEESLPDSEIASRLHIATGTVRSQRCRIIRRLRQEAQDI